MDCDWNGKLWDIKNRAKNPWYRCKYVSKTWIKVMIWRFKVVHNLRFIRIWLTWNPRIHSFRAWEYAFYSRSNIPHPPLPPPPKPLLSLFVVRLLIFDGLSAHLKSGSFFILIDWPEPKIGEMTHSFKHRKMEKCLASW